MKRLSNKIIQITAAGFFSWVLACGIVYAQLVCCNVIADTCIRDSIKVSNINGINYSYGSSPFSLPGSLQTVHCSGQFPVDFGSGKACCEPKQCDNYKQAKYFNASFPHYPLTFERGLSFFGSNGGAQNTFELESRSTSLQSVPIYLLTKSIIC